MPTKKPPAKKTPAKAKKSGKPKFVTTKRRHTITTQPSPARPKFRRGQRVKVVNATPTKGQNYSARLAAQVNKAGPTVVGHVGNNTVRLQAGETSGR